jgi:hypothetical protein
MLVFDNQNRVEDLVNQQQTASKHCCLKNYFEMFAFAEKGACRFRARSRGPPASTV